MYMKYNTRPPPPFRVYLTWVFVLPLCATAVIHDYHIYFPRQCISPAPHSVHQQWFRSVLYILFVASSERALRPLKSARMPSSPLSQTSFGVCTHSSQEPCILITQGYIWTAPPFLPTTQPLIMEVSEVTTRTKMTGTSLIVVGLCNLFISGVDTSHYSDKPSECVADVFKVNCLWLGASHDCRMTWYRANWPFMLNKIVMFCNQFVTGTSCFDFCCIVRQRRG